MYQEAVKIMEWRSFDFQKVGTGGDQLPDLLL